MSNRHAFTGRHTTKIRAGLIFIGALYLFELGGSLWQDGMRAIGDAITDADFGTVD